MKLLKQTGGLLAMEYGLLAVGILSSAIAGVTLFEASFDTELKAIDDEIDKVTADIDHATTPVSASTA